MQYVTSQLVEDLFQETHERMIQIVPSIDSKYHFILLNFESLEV